ncbi:hypothetical protein VHEMI03983 [[Torrubiella] hemipterigena]|nr:hypothetical protein VHEMI03983 [[Torrubiella] hemipterigena]
MESSTAQDGRIDYSGPRAAIGTLLVDKSVTAAFPDKGAHQIDSFKHGESLWGVTGKIIVQLENGETKDYFLKTVSLGDIGRVMCQGEFESLKAIHAACPSFCPEPYAWGKCDEAESDTYFLLAQFREVAFQPASPGKLGPALARMHLQSKSPTGKFGFHIRTCHALIDQAVDFWDDSWSNVFQSHLRHAVELASPVLKWPEFDIVGRLIVEHVVPRLLRPLQEDGRVLKPSLVHGDCWDGNTAVDSETGEAFIFDVCSFYGHNEYDIGNWRAPRHDLSNPAYLANYENHLPKSEPVEEWGVRNILYSLPYNIGNAAFVPDSVQRPV